MSKVKVTHSKTADYWSAKKFTSKKAFIDSKRKDCTHDVIHTKLVGHGASFSFRTCCVSCDRVVKEVYDTA